MKYTEIDNDTVELKFFGSIEYWWQNAQDFTDTFSMLEKRYKTIVILTHCYGGSVIEGNVIFNTINNSKVKVIYRIVGISASMSSIIQMACDEREICDNGFVMIHRPYSGAVGNADDMFSMGKLLKNMEANFTKVYKLKRKGTKQLDMAVMFDGSDHWLTAQEALDYGLVDRIIPAAVKDINDINKPTEQNLSEEIYLKFAASLEQKMVLPTNNLNTEINMKKLLIDSLGLTSVTAESSDTAIMEAIKAKYSAVETANTNLQTQLKTQNETTAKQLIASAEKTAGKEFDANQKTALQNIGVTAGIDALAVALSFVVPVAAPAGEAEEVATTASAPTALSFIKSESKVTAGIPADRASWTWDKWCDEDEAGLMALSAEAKNSIYKLSYKVDMPK